MSTTPPPDGELLAGWDDDDLLGGEATVPPEAGGYTGALRSHLPETRVETPEFREVERRLSQQLSPSFPLEAMHRLPLEFLWKRYRQLAMRTRSTVVDPYGRDPVLVGRVAPILELLYRRYFRVEVSGIGNLPDLGAAVLVANHAGPLPWDALVLMHAVRREHPRGREVRALLEDAVMHAPSLGVLMNRLGAVRASPENGARLLGEGTMVAVFPEGALGLASLYRDRHRLKRFGRGGFVKLALRAGVPIVPVAVVGAHGATPTLARVPFLGRLLGFDALPITPTFPWLGPAGLLPLPSKWRIAFGEPIAVTGDPEDRMQVGRLAVDVRGRIQEMINDLEGLGPEEPAMARAEETV